MKTFPEERDLTRQLVLEWYEAIRRFQTKVDGIFSEKSEQYDVASPVWERIEFPTGFVQEFRKKVDRVKQLIDKLDADDPSSFDRVNWKYMFGELADICNYSRMCAGIAIMLLDRYGISWNGEDK